MINNTMQAHLELGGVLYSVQVYSAFIGQMVEHIASSFCFLASLLEPADTQSVLRRHA